MLSLKHYRSANDWPEPKSGHVKGFVLHTNLAYSGHTPKAWLIKAAGPGARSEQIDRNLYFPPGANRAWSKERTNENG